VRHIALVLIALTATARAEPDADDEDQYFASFPKVSIAAGASGRSTRIDGKADSGATAVLELAYGRGRWQYFLEGNLGVTNLQTTMTTSISGRFERAALGMRWLARQFIPFDPLGVELYLRGAIGVEDHRFVDDTRVSRPDLDVGLSFAARSFRRAHVFTRFDIDMVFARGDTGITAGMVLGW